MLTHLRPTSLPIVILISGNGSNLQAIIDAIKNNALPVTIRAVISNRAEAFGLIRAQKEGISTELIEQTKYSTRQAFDTELQQRIDKYQPALVVLAGFMRILTDAFVDHYRGKIINIHPSLLPAFRGLNTHQRAIDAKVTEHGTTVHFVTRELDGGPIIIQASVSVSAEDDKTTLAERVLEKEHRIYPLAINLVAKGRLHYKNNCIYLDNKQLQKPLTYPPSNNDSA
ncbi:MAG: phosphoribosylglycinamide formyltransferase [Gammaproteobacteria bacterium]|nr:phosphoribosylglycinamide formyltransferase [Gammaproteobacteria bacterium]